MTRAIERRWRLWTLGVVVVAFWGYVMAAKRVPDPAGAAGRTDPPSVSVPVVAAHARVGDMGVYLTGLGTVTPLKTVTVRTQVDGQLVTVAFKEGQLVRAKELLAQIDPRPFQVQLEQAEGQAAKDAATLKNARVDLQRYQVLVKQDAVPKQQLDTQAATVQQLEATLKSDQAQIESARLNLSYSRVTAPTAGRVGLRQVDVGNIIHPTDPNGLVVVTQIEPISVIFSLPETDLPKIQEQMAKGPLTVLAYSQDDTIELDQGKLMLVDNEILQTTGTIRLKAEFPNTAHRLWPGELIDVWLLLDTRHNGLTVQASAVQQGQQGAFTYVINPDNTVAARPVKVAQISRGQALIDAGLTANEQVVVDGQYKLQAGSHVTILHGKAAEEAAAQNAQQNLIP
jgi:multidrug efflux system membrane fusion protein